MSKKTSLKSQLDELELNSWNLELIISGLVLFLLIGSYDYVENAVNYTSYLFSGHMKSRLAMLISLGSLCLLAIWYATTINLILHLFLRGFWMALIGLRYVSGNIELAKLKYNQVFTDELAKMANYDDHIEKIEKICSVIYSATFLIFFFAISFFSFLLFSLLFDFLIGLLPIDEDGSINYGLTLLFMTPWVVFFIDFMGLGWIKKIKKPRFIAYVYLPFYKIISVLSLSFLYRHIFYNLMDNKYGKRVVLLLFVYLFGLFFYSTTFLDTHYFHVEKSTRSLLLEQGKYARSDFYQDQRSPRYIKSFSVPSMHIKGDKLKIFFSYLPQHDALIQKTCPDFEMKENNISIINILFNLKRKNVDYDSFLDCFTSTISVSIGDIQYDSLNYYFQYKTNPNQPGVITYIDISEVPQDEFLLNIQRKYFDPHLDSILTEKILLPLIKN